MSDLYRKLVDLYAGGELPEEMVDDLNQAAAHDESLATDMATLKQTVELLRSEPAPEFNEQDYLRIIFRMQTAGAEIEFAEAERNPGQYQLPM
ncbi:MAG: hypothetical protein JNM28_06645 [Armatimonadetes bacterium]|nr:hypothetical protein [Armatimonadota bacterium]MBS1711685.1 hypothetical protein [Armatimonadota bacterium]MBX3109760.1 hypothetical protein [Fimbriimonadaceae bacterium]